MSLRALIYSKIRITSVDGMIQKVTVGSQIYSSLSLLARQSMLTLTELPEMVSVFELIFQPEYSESYTCNMHGDARMDLVKVFDAILTSRQMREKLQCLYENLISNNFRRTAVLKKISIVD